MPRSSAMKGSLVRSTCGALHVTDPSCMIGVASQVTLLPHLVRLAQPADELLVHVGRTAQPEHVHHTPRADTASNTASKVSRTCGCRPWKCRSSLPSGAQVWLWLALTNSRP